ncbi:hypothetical protein NB689_001700 [Xanthomonas sacchari]|nr:hypothetical protein [Xanthomonas sacchari]
MPSQARCCPVKTVTWQNTASRSIVACARARCDPHSYALPSGGTGGSPFLTAGNRIHGESTTGQHPQGLRQRPGRRARGQLRSGRRRTDGAGRAVGLRQVHAAADDRRPGRDQRRRVAHRRARGQRGGAEGPRHRHGVPELCAVPAHDRGREPGVRAQAARREQGGHPPARGRRRRHPGPDPDAGQAAARHVRRPAPARGAGSRPGARAGGVPARRAAVQPGRQAAPLGAHRDRATAPQARHHHDLRHPRPGRGDDPGPAHRRAQGRADPADRHADGAVRPPGQSVRGRFPRQPGDERAARAAGGRERPAAAVAGRRAGAAAGCAGRAAVVGP